MNRDDSVAQRKAQLDAAEVEALGGCYDDGFAEGKSGGGGGFTQADIDNAVAAQKASDDADKASAVAAVQAELDAQSAVLAQLQSDKASEDEKLASDESIIQGLKDGQDKIQAALDALKALISG